MIKLLIILSLMLVIPLSANAQIVGDGTDNVTIHDYPFDITILEGGSFTLYNYNGTGSISIVSPGWFEEHEALENNTVTVRLLPETIPGTYIVNDVNNDTIISTVTVVETFVPELTIDITVSNDVGNSYVKMTGTTPYQNEEITFVFFDSNQNVIDRYTHVTGYDGSYNAIWRILDYLQDGTYYVTLDDQVTQFEWRSIDGQLSPNIPVDNTVVDPVEVITQVVDKEVLNLRLQILQVIESIFRIVLE